jgi:quercetin dioxygenase-like cupin family protein
MTGIVRTRERRRIETPNATMTTLASPTLGATAHLSMWQVEMAAGSCGPSHWFDSEQLWTLVEGDVSATIGGEAVHLTAGDTLVLPAGIERRIAAKTPARLLVCGHGDAVARVPGEQTPRGTPAWIS